MIEDYSTVLCNFSCRNEPFENTVIQDLFPFVSFDEKGAIIKVVRLQTNDLLRKYCCNI